MVKYRVVIFPAALRDIDNIYLYIALQKLAPENAKGQTDRIWDKLKTLESNPQKHQERLVGRFAGKGYRQLLIDNYVAIYRIDEKKRIVNVITVQYQGRDV
ncbi:MAG: type II toxin-antitoxin system RelE/ParE family toxin [Lachnospiraceae bacterium]|nr:type II toxin-antitoxin system RelE/ParE family toxin [Lachnospiraceae bacterium]MBR6270622.1 type II toxin-antitoxin system RelE/ParE family toxin [Lachnospiraceae bacterium]